MPCKASAGGSSRSATRLSAPSGSPAASKRAAEATRESMLSFAYLLSHGFLVHEDFVAVQVFQHHPGAIRSDLRFAVKFHAQLFHTLVVTAAIMGLHPKIWVAAALLAQ